MAGEKNPFSRSKVEEWQRSRMEERIWVRVEPDFTRVSVETWSRIRCEMATPICCLTHLPPVLKAPPRPVAVSPPTFLNQLARYLMDSCVEMQEDTASPNWAFFLSWNFIERPAPASDRL